MSYDQNAPNMTGFLKLKYNAVENGVCTQCGKKTLCGTLVDCVKAGHLKVLGVPEFSFRNIFSEKICLHCLPDNLAIQGITLQSAEDLFYFIPAIWHNLRKKNTKETEYELAKKIVPEDIMHHRNKLEVNDYTVTFNHQKPSADTDYWRNATEGEMEIYDSLIGAFFNDPKSFEARTIVEFARQKLEQSGLVKSGGFYRMGPGVLAAEQIRQSHIDKFMFYQREYFGG